MKLRILISVMTTLTLLGCGSEDKLGQVDIISPPITTDSPKLVAFAPDNKPQANIRWTEYGVPHIKADNLQGIGFGSGYAYAHDNICILADQIVKVRSERSKYFGPDKQIGSGDSKNVVSDFGHLALQVMVKAKTLYPDLSENSRALIEGYVAGYNKYLSDTGVENLAPECKSQLWVKTITPQELLAYMFSTSQLSSGLKFLELAFYANPNADNQYLPYLGPRTTPASKPVNFASLENQLSKTKLPVIKNEDFGSNAWGIGKSLSHNQQGILLANPHFPHTGNLRFWQSHLTIPGVLNVQGAALHGMPGVINIGFNQNLAWSHTVSASNRFALYQLSLAANSPLQYQYDDEVKTIEKKTFFVEVGSGNASVVLAKDYYYSHYGLMIETPPELPLFPWTEQTAFSLKDAAEFNTELVDHWLAMNLAKNLTEFQAAFEQYNGIPWVNTVYADDKGNAFYIDKSRVLNLNDTALAQLRENPVFNQTYQQTGFYVLPGNTALFEPAGLNSYEQAPKLLRDDFVQNSNDSYWASNPAQTLSGYSLLYGQDHSPLSLRTRMSLKMLDELTQNSQKVDPQMVEDALLNNRSYLAELVLPDLLNQCQAQGNIPLVLQSGLAVDISAGCAALAQFNGKMNQNSIGAHLFREFAFRFNSQSDLTVPFDANNPANTPNTLATNESILQKLAAAQASIQAAGLSLTASLGDVQFTEKTLADGQASGERFAWGGAHTVEGGFNVFNTNLDDDTLYPMHSYPTVTDIETGQNLPSALTEQGYLINSGSSWAFIVNFTQSGPEARGLLFYSQSTNSTSEHFDDQNRHYSVQQSLRPIVFTEADVTAKTVAEIQISQ